MGDRLPVELRFLRTSRSGMKVVLRSQKDFIFSNRIYN